MARILPPLQHFRGTTAQHAEYTGPIGELTIDTDKKAVVVQDGATAGGITMAREDRQISAGSGLKINSTSSATLASDIEITIDGAGIADALVAANDELLSVNDDGKITASIDLAYNTTTGKFDITNGAGDIVATVTVPSSTSMLQNAELVVNPEGQEPGTYLKLTMLLADGSTSDIFVNVGDLIDVYTGGDGIDITSNEVKVDLAANNNLAVIQAGKLIVPSDLGTMVELA